MDACSGCGQFWWSPAVCLYFDLWEIRKTASDRLVQWTTDGLRGTIMLYIFLFAAMKTKLRCVSAILGRPESRNFSLIRSCGADCALFVKTKPWWMPFFSRATPRRLLFLGTLLCDQVSYICRRTGKEQVAVLKVFEQSSRSHHRWVFTTRIISEIDLHCSDISTRVHCFICVCCRSSHLLNIAAQKLMLRFQNPIQTFVSELKRCCFGNSWGLHSSQESRLLVHFVLIDVIDVYHFAYWAESLQV